MIITQPFVSIAWTPLVFWRWRLFCNTSVFRNMWHIHAVFQDKTNNTLRQPSDASTPSPRAPMVRVVSSLTIRIWQCKKAGSMSIPSLFHAPSTFLNSSSALVLAMSLLGSDTERLIAHTQPAVLCGHLQLGAARHRAAQHLAQTFNPDLLRGKMFRLHKTTGDCYTPSKEKQARKSKVKQWK